jgi:5-methyltetrahydropteroyltriglutamate--homocysteine methyltransferase
MLRSEERFVVSHVGSLVRPPALINFLENARDNRPFDPIAFDECLSQSIDEVVRLQLDAGIDVVSDGEYGKSITWAFYVHKRLSGVDWRQFTDEELSDPTATVISGRDREAFPEFYSDYDAKMLGNARAVLRPVITGPITYVGQDELQRDIRNLKASLTKAGKGHGFLPVVAPASAIPNAKNKFYRDEEAYLFGLSEALRTEYQAIIDAGLDLQVDDAGLPIMYEKMVPPLTLADYRKWASLRIDALNYALRGLPKDRTRYHICWGSWNGPHMFDVPFRDIVDLMLRVDVGAYSFEAANPRHEHEWRLWQDVRLPADKVLMPGLITHSTNVVEHPELIAERLLRFVDCVGRENVMAGSDCGFSQSPLGARVHSSIMWAKLRSLAGGTEIAAKRAWGK